MRWIKDAMIINFLKQVLKLFWDNCKWAVLSHLLEKILHFLSNCLDGVRFFFIFNCLLQFEFLYQLISEYWNRTTTLIPFLQAITHFCNFIPSNFMEGFAFLIDDTSYVQDWHQGVYFLHYCVGPLAVWPVCTRCTPWCVLCSLLCRSSACVASMYKMYTKMCTKFTIV